MAQPKESRRDKQSGTDVPVPADVNDPAAAPADDDPRPRMAVLVDIDPDQVLACNEKAGVVVTIDGRKLRAAR